jgi:hypothetical protein
MLVLNANKTSLLYLRFLSRISKPYKYATQRLEARPLLRQLITFSQRRLSRGRLNARRASPFTAPASPIRDGMQEMQREKGPQIGYEERFPNQSTPSQLLLPDFYEFNHTAIQTSESTTDLRVTSGRVRPVSGSVAR